MRRWALLATIVFACGCTPLEHAFTCTTDDMCRDGSLQGLCEATRACSFPDANCGSGRRYGSASAAALALTCVDGTPPDGGAADGPPAPHCGELGEPCCAGATACTSPMTCTMGVCSGCVTAVATGDAHTCALRTNGTVVCWGKNDAGQLGTGNTADSLAPALVIAPGGAPLDGVIELAAGAAHTCARRSAGTVLCWGNGSDGQLGDAASPPTQSTPGLIGISDLGDIAAGSRHSCAALNDGRAYCWGKNDGGQLGTPPPAGTNGPAAVLIGGTQLDNVARMAGGATHTCAIRKDQTLWCWGSNNAGELGNGGTSASAGPVAVSVLGAMLADVSAGSAFTCAALASGGVSCWGADLQGQSGQPASPSVSVPTAIAGLTLVTQLAAGTDHVCARRSDGTAVCWGRNQRGQLGDSTQADRAQFAPVLDPANQPVTHVTRVAAGLAHGCAIRAQGVICWGANESGQLGDGKLQDRTTATTSLMACP